MLPPQAYGLQDLEWEIREALGRYQDDYWEPVTELTSSYVSSFELRESVEIAVLNLWSESNENSAVYRDRREVLTSELTSNITQSDVSDWLQSRFARLGSQYEPYRQHITRKIVEAAREEFQRRREGAHGRLLRGHWTVEAVEWIGLAAGSGVLGNLAYDIIKKGWTTKRPGRLRNLLRRRRDRFDREVDPDEALAYLAKVAVRERCRKLNFVVPAITDLRLGSWTAGPESIAVSISAHTSEMHAVVEIPYSELETRGLLVSVSYPR